MSFEEKKKKDKRKGTRKVSSFSHFLVADYSQTG